MKMIDRGKEKRELAKTVKEKSTIQN